MKVEPIKVVKKNDRGIIIRPLGGAPHLEYCFCGAKLLKSIY